MTQAADAQSHRNHYGKSTIPLVGGEQEITAILQTLRAGECCRFIGARYHQKSSIMREACHRIHYRDGFIGLYVSIEGVRTTSQQDFYTTLREWIVRKTLRYCRRRLPRHPVRSSSEFKIFLVHLPNALNANIALFVDDLERAPAEFVTELLDVLRAAYQDTTTGLRLLAVVCASNSLAHTALGSTSPFENISPLITVDDLNRAETYSLAHLMVAEQCGNPTRGALDLIYDQTNGDRFLVAEIAQECCRLLKEKRGKRVARETVQMAIQHWVQRGGHHAVAEGLRHIENDSELLLATLKLLHENTVPSAQFPFDPTHPPDPLTTSGFGVLDAGHYHIKSKLHRALLMQHFSPDHIGRIFFAAGDWEHAIEYLRTEVQRDTPALRERVMLPALNAMYAVESKQAAYQYLQNGLESAYPHLIVRFYDLDPVRNVLVEVNSAATEQGRPSARISLQDTQRPEIKALKNRHEYWPQPVGRYRQTLFIPLRVGSDQPLGLLAVENLVTAQNIHHRQEQILELVGYARHAARALQNRQAYEQLNHVNVWHAKNLERLLALTRQLMSSRAKFPEILDQVIRSALKALNHAQRGSIYLYEQQTGQLKMQAQTGYPPAVRAAAQFRPGEGLAGYVYLTGRTYIAHDTHTDRHYAPLPMDTQPVVRSSMGVPLVGTRGIMGVLCLDNARHTYVFDDEDKKLLELYAGQVALWLESVRLLEAQQHSRESALLASRLLHQISSAVSLIPELAEEVTGTTGNAAADAPSHELSDIAQAVDYIGGWLDKYVRVGNISIESVDVPALIAEVIQRVEHERPPQVVVNQLASEGRLSPIRADPKLISILVENLLLNAYDALRGQAAGEVTVQLKMEKDECVVRIHNNGPDISPEHREEIWKPGWTTKADIAGRYGRGLGLSLCRQIAVAHEGTLVLEDSSAEGCVTFTMHLPLGGPRSLPEI